jgi:Predicted hydrolases of HD superfamily
MNRNEIDQEKALQYIKHFNLARNGGGVRRYHTHRVVCEDTVASHSWGVAVLVDMLYGGSAPAQVLRAALYHDVAEHVFGDIPSPAKRLFNNEELRQREDQLMRDNGMFTILTDWERFVMKLADMLDGLTYCVEERERGNTTLIPIWNTYYVYIHDRINAEADKFAATVEPAVFNCVMDRLGYTTGLIKLRMESANAQR